MVAGYAVLTTCYSAFLKQVPILDLVILSAGFILRLLGGAYAAGVEVSEWFLLVSLFGSMFIAAAKRYAEKHELGDRAAELRPTLGAYSFEFLALVRTSAIAAVTMSYCLWAVERGQMHGGAATPWISCRSSVRDRHPALRTAGRPGYGSAPEEVFAEDRMMQLMGCCWPCPVRGAVPVGRVARPPDRSSCCGAGVDLWPVPPVRAPNGSST